MTNTSPCIALAAALALTSVAGLGGALAAPATAPIGSARPERRVTHRVPSVRPDPDSADRSGAPPESGFTTLMAWTHTCGWTSLQGVNIPGETRLHCFGCHRSFTLTF